MDSTKFNDMRKIYSTQTMNKAFYALPPIETKNNTIHSVPTNIKIVQLTLHK